MLERLELKVRNHDSKDKVLNLELENKWRILRVTDFRHG